MIALMPRFWASRTFREKTSGKEKMDPTAPRTLIHDIQNSQALDSRTKGRLYRAEAAVLNSFENFGLFAAAVVAGSAARLDATLLNGVTFTYLASRALYAYIYVNNETAAKARSRAFTYMGGLGLLCTLFFKAGQKFNQTLL